MTRYVPYDPRASEVDQPETTGHTYHDDFGNAWVSVPDLDDDDYVSYEGRQANLKARREAEAARAAAEAARAAAEAAKAECQAWNARQQVWVDRMIGVLVVLLFVGMGVAVGGGVAGGLVVGGIVVLVMAVTGYGRGSDPNVQREP